MSVVIETTIGDITVDLFVKERPRSCLNFLKLCQIKYYNFCSFHTIERNFIAQSGDPTGVGNGGESVFLSLYGENARMFEMETKPKIKHKRKGMVSMVNNGEGLHGSQFFITLADDLDYLDGIHTVFGHVVEGFDVLDQFNDWICDSANKPFKDILITHTVILEDPFPHPKGLDIPPQSPEVSEELLKSDRIGVHEDIDDTDGKDAKEIEEMIREKEAKERALVLEMIGDIPDADVKPPETVLFVCKLNPVTREDDLEVIFSRFGAIASCEVIRDQKSGESLQYAFIEFCRSEDCEKAFFKMDNVLIDDRRIHVDFSQSVSKIKWLGKGKGVTVVNDFKDKPDHRDHRPRDQFRIKTGALGQRTDSKYDYVYDNHNNDYQIMLPKTSHKSRSNHRSPDRERERERHHRSKRSKRSSSESSDAQTDRYRERERERDRDRHRNRSSDKYRDKDRERVHKSKFDERHRSKDHHRRHRTPSPGRTSHSKSSRQRR